MMNTRLYVPWSGRDAMEKLKVLLTKPSPSIRDKYLDWTNGTSYFRMIDIMTGKGEQWMKSMENTTRTPVSESKY